MEDNKIKAITEQLEKGVREVFTSENFINYLTTLSKFHNYSANNCLLIWMQCPEASRVAGFKTWEKLGRHVIKGQKAIKILAPLPCKFTTTEVDNDGNETEKEVNFLRFRSVPVFDISQTEGQALADICSELDGNVESLNTIIEKISSIIPVEFKVIDSGAKGYYSHVDNNIVINEGMSDLQTVKTLLHEFAHSILHNKENGSDKDADRNTKEVEAESVAYIVSSFLGLDTSSYSFEYVASWSSSKEVKELEQSISIIQQTAKEIIDIVA